MSRLRFERVLFMVSLFFFIYVRELIAGNSIIKDPPTKVKVKESVSKDNYGLQSLDFNCETDVPTMDCSSLDIESIDHVILQPEIRNLKLSHNKLKSINEPILAQNLEILDLSMNSLSSIGVNAFDNLSSLLVLDLSHNRLWSLDTQLTKLKSLVHLDLSFNEIGNLDSTWFEHLIKLNRLDLNNNKVSLLDTDVFSGLTNLEELHLSHCALRELPDEIFRDNFKLKSLFLDNNQFSKVPTQALAVASNLQFLDLGANEFESLNFPDFDGLSSVVKLRLEKMRKLRTIGPHTFQGMNNLTHFYCSQNMLLRFVSSKAFYDNASDKVIPLKGFTFRHNAVNGLAREVIDWKSLETVDLAGNPWSCDCHLGWIIMVKFEKEKEDHAKCFFPPYLRDRIISQMAPDEFRCSFLMQHEFTVVGTLMLIITISMTVVVLLYLLIKISPCLKCKNPFRRSYGYSKVKVTKNGRSFDLEWDPTGDPN